MLHFLLREYRSHRMARVILWVIVVLVVLWIAGRILHPLHESGWALTALCVVIAGIYYLLRLIALVRRRLLWRLSRRLVVAYLFIAFVPVVLILCLVLIGAMIINGQFAAFLVNQRLKDHFDELKQLNRVVAHEAIHTRARTPGGLMDDLESFYRNELGEYAYSYPGLDITLRVGDEARAFRLTGETQVAALSLPRWLREEEWAGLASDADHVALRAVDHEETPAGWLTLILSMPVTPPLLNMVGEDVGPVKVYEPVPSGPEPRVIGSSSLERPRKLGWFDLPVFGLSEINPVEWRASQFQRRSTPVVVEVDSRIFALNGQLFSTLGRHSSAPVDFFIAICIAFLVIELIALVLGISLTRSITSTVNKLQIATEQVRAGDFTHRIGLPARDQVSSLGEAFDTMTSSVQRLMIEAKEKLRLESELEIARQVQSQLFPRQAPEVPAARLFGVCRPARGVSGDYYDFLRLDHEHLALVLGDVSGKGIFAALLMAGIQSAIHAQFYDGHGGGVPAPAVPLPPAEVVARLNRQLYENSPDAKYATFFYAVYHTASRTLTYTNAGHPAPIVFQRDGMARLQTGGTVLGLFSSPRFQQAQVELHPGDLLLAFTDGMTEPENTYGEEFGEDRLIEAVREAMDSPPEILVSQIYSLVMDWTGSAELQDDMTMLYLKATN